MFKYTDFSVRWTATRTNINITISVIFRCLSTVNISLPRAYLWAWIMKILPCWCRGCFSRRPVYITRPRDSDNTRYVYKRLFFLIFDFTPGRGGSEGHTSHPENGNIRIELKFNKPLPEAITCLLYLEFDKSVFVDFARTLATDF